MFSAINYGIAHSNFYAKVINVKGILIAIPDIYLHQIITRLDMVKTPGVVYFGPGVGLIDKIGEIHPSPDIYFPVFIF